MLIEFALALPVLALMLVGLLDLSRFALQKTAMLEGARQGAQYGVVAYSDSNHINITAQNASGLTGVTATNNVFCECVAGTSISCTSTCTGGGSPKRYITVTLSKPFASVLTSGSLNFGVFGNFSPPTSMSASVTLIVP